MSTAKLHLLPSTDAALEEDQAPALVVRDVSASLRHRLVLREVSFDVAEGSVTALVGPNGSGKTTLLRILAKLQRFSGSVHIGAFELSQLHPAKVARQIAYVPQNPIFPPGIRVDEYVRLGQLSRAKPRSSLDEILEACNLAPLANRPLDQLSGGEQRRAALALGLAQDTPILLLDEPSASLDIGHADRTFALIRELADRFNRTTILATHDLPLAAQYSDTYVALREGMVLDSGAANQAVSPRLLRALYDLGE